MTQENFIILLFAGIMLWLAIKDEISFRRDQPVNYKSMIVSIGILGTFVGIIFGLWDFNTQDIATSVPQLLEGLKLAFLTSIIGMGLSIFLSVLQAEPDKKSREDTVIRLKTIQRIDAINQNLVAILKSIEKQNTDNQILVTISDTLKSIEKQNGDNQVLTTILDTVKQLRNDIYERRYRFTKLDADGQALPDEATQWIAIQDNETSLIWEMKTNDGGLQDGKHTYTWYHPDSQIKGTENGGDCEGCRCDTQAYVEAVNKTQLAGYHDWRMPTIEELQTLVNEESPLDKRYFPHLDVQECGWYSTSSPDSIEEETVLCVSFDSGHLGPSKHGYGHILLTRSPVIE
ncbi:conserved hypothetical protein, membrane [Beggiatoa sp. PS]|nr:conserved hypothetical protein, membrane [Beggiatoa sp. PS]